MHSFHQSRGKIFFEALCALAVSASLAGAWMQTGAWALLPAAGIAALYGLVRSFDMAGRRPAIVEEPQRIEFEPTATNFTVPMIAPEEQPSVGQVAAEAEAVEPAPTRTGAGRRSGGSRKSSGRRARSPKVSTAAVLAPAEQADVPMPMAEEARLPEVSSPGEEEFAFIPEEESPHPHIAPLFEPEPFARMPRPAFGRRGRL